MWLALNKNHPSKHPYSSGTPLMAVWQTNVIGSSAWQCMLPHHKDRSGNRCPQGLKMPWMQNWRENAWKNCNPCCAAGTMVLTWTLTEAALSFTNPVLKIHGVTWKAVKYVRKHSATCALTFYNTLVLVVFGWRALILPFAHILGSP